MLKRRNDHSAVARKGCHEVAVMMLLMRRSISSYVSNMISFGLVGVYLSRQNEKNNPPPRVTQPPPGPPGHHIHTFIHDKVAISKVRIHYTKILVY